MSHDCESEIEELMNPKDELKKKIVTVADTIREWNKESRRVSKTVKEQFEEILNLGLNKYKMEKTALRSLVEEIFLIHGVSESWFRKLLPTGLKDPSKIRISYLQRQNIEKERQRLLQERALESQQESEIREYDLPNGSTAESVSFRPLEPDTIQSYSEIRQEVDIDYSSEYHSQDHAILSSSHSDESIRIQSELSEANKKIKRLEADVRQLSEEFVAKANLQALTETIPVVAHIDPVKKAILRIGFEKGSGI